MATSMKSGMRSILAEAHTRLVMDAATDHRKVKNRNFLVKGGD